MSIFKKYFLNGDNHIHCLTIDYDTSPLDPREEWDNLGTLCLWWGNYSLGDNKGKEDPHTILVDLLREVCSEDEIIKKALSGDFETKYTYDKKLKCYKANRGLFNYHIEEYEVYDDICSELSNAELMKLIQSYDNVILLSCYIYEHGGLTISCSGGNPFNDRWDSGCAGFIYTTQKESLKWGYTKDNWKERATNCLISEVETYDAYLKGEVYGYSNEDLKDSSLDDSCWGFYSDKYGTELIKEMCSEAGIDYNATRWYDEDDIEWTPSIKKGV